MIGDAAEQVSVRVEPLLVGVEDAGRMLGISGKGVRRQPLQSTRSPSMRT